MASIVIVVLRDTRRLLQCLDSIRMNVRLPHEVIVVANGTAESELEPVCRRGDVFLLRFRVNLGFARGCNEGAALTRGRYIVVLNDDTTVEPEWLEALLEGAETTSQVGAVGSAVLDAQGRWLEAGYILWRNGMPHRLPRSLVAESNDQPYDVDYCSGCSLLVPRDVWQLVGGFSEAYFPAYFEDADLGMRLHLLGLRVLVQPRSVIRHHERASSTETEWGFIWARNQAVFRQIWGAVLRNHQPRPTGLSVEVAEHVRRRLQGYAKDMPRRGTRPWLRVVACTPSSILNDALEARYMRLEEMAFRQALRLPRSSTYNSGALPESAG